jgi:hypothetical protein
MSKQTTTALFSLGKTYITPGAMDALSDAYGEDSFAASVALLHRHQTGDWGDLCAADKKANAAALRDEARILSAYKLPEPQSGDPPQKLWIITEWDRSATTILLPEEY